MPASKKRWKAKAKAVQHARRDRAGDGGRTARLPARLEVTAFPHTRAGRPPLVEDLVGAF